jgi:uncharacterized membrane protein YoaK (UPF0700 family)
MGRLQVLGCRAEVLLIEMAAVNGLVDAESFLSQAVFTTIMAGNVLLLAFASTGVRQGHLFRFLEGAGVGVAFTE